MKNLLTTLLLLAGVSAFGQGTAIRSLNGIGTNVNLKSTTTLKNAAETATITLVPSLNGASSRLTINGVPVAADVIIEDSVITADRFIGVTTPGFVGYHTGNGAGLTNLNLGSFTNQAPVTFNGRVTLVSNVFFNVVSYSTNSAASETTIDLSKSYRAFSTNNNTAFSALAGIESAQTNVQSCNIFITNSSASAKTITMAASFQNMNAIEGNTLSVTNVGHLLVFYYPGFGTNFYFKSR